MTGPTPPSTREPGARRLLRPRVVIAFVALVLAVIFIAINTQTVRIHFIFFTVSSELWIGFLVSLVFGALLGQAFGAIRRQRRANRSHDRS